MQFLVKTAFLRCKFGGFREEGSLGALGALGATRSPEHLE